MVTPYKRQKLTLFSALLRKAWGLGHFFALTGQSLELGTAARKYAVSPAL